MIKTNDNSRACKDNLEKLNNLTLTYLVDIDVDSISNWVEEIEDKYYELFFLYYDKLFKLKTIVEFLGEETANKIIDEGEMELGNFIKQQLEKE